MTTLPILLAAVVWIFAGVVNYGATLAYFQRKYAPIAKWKFNSDRHFALLFALGGPISLLVVWYGSERFKYGFMFQWKEYRG